MLRTGSGRTLAALGAAAALASMIGAEARGAGGRLVVKSTPAGASVYLDDEDDPRGVTPLEIAKLPSKLYKVRVSLAGYAVQKRGFYLAPGGEREFKFSLVASGEEEEPSPAPRRRKPSPEPEPVAEEEEEEEPAAEEEPVPRTIDVACPVCEGSKVMSKMGCATCKGTGYIDTDQCTQCGGSRRVEYLCPYCRGEGKIAAGGQEKECPGCRGERHLPCKACRGQGTIQRPNPEAAKYPTADCPTCNGSGFQLEAQCTFCGGDGSMWIGRTGAAGGARRPGGFGGGGNNVNTREKVQCPYCSGDGKGTPLCRRCQGRAFQGSGRTLRPCDTCCGTGLSFIPCRSCRGAGWVRSRE